MRILLTGGAGFIGSALVRRLIETTEHEVMNIDKLTYAGNLKSLSSIENNNRYTFKKIDIVDRAALENCIGCFKPNAIMHLAAESHVDRSISNPGDFIQTNIVGTYNILEASRLFWSSLTNLEKTQFRFHHISTDEVYGDLGNTNKLFTEETPYNPSSPYSSSKAASDHLVRAWHRTYMFPSIITNCSNNYGPFQYPEKLIPLQILNALNENPITIYGDGMQVRDWLYVDDHAEALIKVIEKGLIGETYNIGGHNEITNLDVVTKICKILDKIRPLDSKKSYAHLIKFVEDRPGHDLRYAINANKIKTRLDWSPSETFDSGLRKTINWFLEYYNL